MPQNVLIFANPIAGKGKGKLLANRLLERFRAEGWTAHVTHARPCDVPDVTGLTAAVSIGGDGTLRAVVERVTDDGQHEGPGVLVVPMGTANLMGRHLQLDLREAGLEHRAVQAISRRNLARLDVGRVTSRAQSDTDATTTRLFLLMVGVGIDGAVVHALDRVRTGPIGFTSYVLPGLGALANYPFHPIDVEVDGRRVWRNGPAIAFAGNVKEYGTGFPILPLAKSDDELLDVCVLPANSPADLIKHALATLTGDHHHLAEGAVYVKGKHVTVRSHAPVAIQADGDPAGYTPTEIELLKTRVAFLT